MPRLGGHELGRALHAGIRRLLGRQEQLDRINVFPVADGDTGTNLAITLGAVLATLTRVPGTHAGALLTRVADAALDGARGNSGAILAQFLLGVGDRAGPHAELAPRDFAEAAQLGARYAREALSEPREGTILTVAQDFASEALAAAAADEHDFGAMYDRALVRARSSLAATRDQLDALRSAGVVDAGAAGFVELLEGIGDYLRTGELDESAPLPVAVHDESAHAAGLEQDLAHRWCTECVVSGEAIDRRALRESLATLGSSLVVAGTGRKARVHVHVADPAEVFRTVAAYGTVSGQKADDMQRQQGAAHHAGRRQVAIVTDSAADIPDELLERLDIHVVPVRVHFGEQSYLDKVSLTPEAFYRLLATHPQHPKTSQPPPGDFRRLYEFLTSHYASVVSISVTALASGTFQAAQSAAARLAAHERVTVIDSRNASLGEGLLAVYAAECADAGYDAARVVAAVEALRARTRTYACLRTLDYAVRGGRVPPFARRVANALGVSPLLASFGDGRVGVGGVLLGRRDRTAKFARWVRRRIDPAKRWRIAIGHGDAPEEGRRLLESITAGLPNVESTWLVPLGTALGVHGGPGMLVAGLQEYTPPAP